MIQIATSSQVAEVVDSSNARAFLHVCFLVYVVDKGQLGPVCFGAKLAISNLIQETENQPH